MLTEPLQLWVMAITVRLLKKNVAREQTFTPQGHEALAIEEPWVNGP